jgi:hypothetical protein
LYGSCPLFERSDIRVGVIEVCETVFNTSIVSSAAPRTLPLLGRVVCDEPVEALLAFVEGSYCAISGGIGTSGRMRRSRTPSGSAKGQMLCDWHFILSWRYQGIQLLNSVKMTVAPRRLWLNGIVACSVARGRGSETLNCQIR